ncbi:hypothetical protein ALP36_100033 [Pseudomonas syringae pv. coriandricola]|nr:hypothetical protein ALP87_100030 [Pseudomonas syringae pv. coriandricola]RMU06547.1 hypothetical protein ALP36_100033 [Pseudomonas syringae pv. coriandricola]
MKMAGPGHSGVCGCWHEGVHLCDGLMRWRVKMQNDPDWEPENIRLVQRRNYPSKVSIHSRGNIMGSSFNGLVGLIILALDIWAIINVLKSGAETGKKILWVLLIVLLPVVGLIIWAILGPRGNVRI